MKPLTVADAAEAEYREVLSWYRVFVELPDRLDVIFFAHNRRRPAYFIDRLKRS